MNRPSWSDRTPSRRVPTSARYDAPLLLLAGGEAQTDEESAHYDALRAKEGELRQALTQVDSRIRGVVILPFTAQGPGSDSELLRQGYGAQALILTELPGTDPAVWSLTGKLHALSVECPMHMSAYADAAIPGHILRGGARALIAPEEAGRLEAFMRAHQPETAANARQFHGLR